MLSGEALEVAGQRLLQEMIKTASGRFTRSEALADEEVVISRI